jgi:integrase
VQNAVKNARKCAGIIKPVTPHTLRHRYATHLLEAILAKGWRERDALAEVQKSLRHKNPRTTEIYVHLIQPAEKDVRSPLDEL